MKNDTLTEAQITKEKDERIKKRLVTTLLELILINQVLMIMDNLVEKVLTLLSQLKKKTEKSTEMLLIDDLSKRLLELEFKSNHSIKSKCLK